MRFPIKFKVVALGAVLSILVSSAALIMGYTEYLNRSKANQLNDIDEQLTILKTNLTTGGSSKTLNSTLNNVATYMKAQYALYPDEPEEGLSYDELKEFYMNRFKFLYAIEDMGMYFMPESERRFREAYENFIDYLTDLQNATESVTAYVGYVVDDTFFYMGDDCAYRGKAKIMHYLPGSRYHNFNPEFVPSGDYYDVTLDDKLNKVYIHETDNGNNYYFFLEYNFNKVIADTNSLLRVEIIALSITSVLMIIAYAVGAHILLLRNVNKLTKSAEEFTENVKSSSKIEVKDPKVKSRDEMKSLSNSFVALEESIVNYIDVIQKETLEKERMNVELNVANNIQLSALPNKIYTDDNVSIRASIKSAKEVGGDFYDYFYLDKNRLVVVISDVSGKGIPAALFMMKSKELIKSAIHSNDNLVDAVTEVNKTLVWNDKESLFVTSFIGVIDFSKNIITYVNAGHEKPYIITNKGIIKLDGESNFVMGGEEDFVYKQESHKFNKGESLFLFTDGLNESINSNREEFSYSRIEETLEANKDQPSIKILNNMSKALEEFVGEEEQFDDVTMLVIKNNDHKLHMSYNKKEYEIIDDIVDTFNMNFSTLPTETRSAAGVIIDEVINNLISYETREDLEIDLDFEATKKELNIVISCNGHDYNPFENHKEKYLEEYKDDIEEGGLGISIIKDLAEKYSYKYENNRSILSFSVKIR